MFAIFLKNQQSIIISSSKKELSKYSGIPYSTLCYYSRKGYYENMDIVFTKCEILKSNQGGKRTN